MINPRVARVEQCLCLLEHLLQPRLTPGLRMLSILSAFIMPCIPGSPTRMLALIQGRLIIIQVFMGNAGLHFGDLTL